MQLLKSRLLAEEGLEITMGLGSVSVVSIDVLAMPVVIVLLSVMVDLVDGPGLSKLETGWSFLVSFDCLTLLVGGRDLIGSDCWLNCVGASG